MVSDASEQVSRLGELGGELPPMPVAQPLQDPFRADLKAGQYWGNFDALRVTERRGQLPFVNLWTSEEVSQGTRSELLRKIRWLRNVGLIRGIIHNAANLIGVLRPIAQSDDAEWNAEANLNFEARAGAATVFDMSGRFDFYSAQPMINRAALGDGDILTVLTEGPSRGARVAFYEAHQVMNPNRAGDRWRDGVLLDRHGRHLAYGVRHKAGDNSAVIPARDALLYGFFERVGHVRPLPPLTHAINTAVDIVEMRADLKHGLKVNNLAAAYRVKKNGPGARSGGGGLPAAAQERLVSRGSTPDGTKTQKVALQDAYAGGMMPQLEPDEQIQLVVDPRPHSNQRDFINDDLIRDIAVGMELMPEVVWKLSGLNGPEMRYVLAMVSRWIRIRLKTQVEWCHRIWVYHMAKEIRRGALRAPRDEWWMYRSKVRYVRQADPTIDRGREGKERREALRDGIGTEEDLYEEFGGEGFKENALKRHEEIMYKKELAEAGGYPVEWVIPNQKATLMDRKEEGE